MLGKKIKVDIFGTLAEGSLYSGFITDDPRADKRQIYVMTNHEISGVQKCTVIAIASAQNKTQTRLIAAPLNEIYYEPEIRSRLKNTSLRYERIICMYEKSCGAVIYRKTYKDGIKILLVKNHNGKCWTFPKGHIEANESEKQTALREIKEETGLTVTIEPNFRQTSIYRPFGKIKKQVVFFLARANEAAVNMQPTEIDYYLWVTLDEAMRLCSHENDTKILREVKKRLYPNKPYGSKYGSKFKAQSF